MNEDDIAQKIVNGELSFDALKSAIVKAEGEKLKNRFPFTTTIYVHGDDESHYFHFKELGFSDDEIDRMGLANLAYEIALTFVIQENGNATLIEVDGCKVLPKDA